jgi:adenosine deaminase
MSAKLSLSLADEIKQKLLEFNAHENVAITTKDITALLKEWVALVHSQYKKGRIPSFFLKDSPSDIPFFFQIERAPNGKLVPKSEFSWVEYNNEHFAALDPKARVKLMRAFELWFDEQIDHAGLKAEVTRLFRQQVLPKLAYIFEGPKLKNIQEFLLYRSENEQIKSSDTIPHSQLNNEEWLYRLEKYSDEQILEGLIFQIIQAKEREPLYLLQIQDLYKDLNTKLTQLQERDIGGAWRPMHKEIIKKLQNRLKDDEKDHVPNVFGHRNLFARMVQLWIKRLEKAERHLHFSGSIPPEDLLKLYWKYPEARRNFFEKFSNARGEVLIKTMGYSLAPTMDSIPQIMIDRAFAAMLELKLPGEETWSQISKNLNDEELDIFDRQYEVYLYEAFSQEKWSQAVEVFKKYIEFRPRFQVDNKDLMNHFLYALNVGEIVLRLGSYPNRAAAYANVRNSFKDGATQMEMNSTAGNRPGSQLSIEDTVRAIIQGFQRAEKESGDRLQTGLTIAVRKEIPALLAGAESYLVGQKGMEALRTEAKKIKGYDAFKDTMVNTDLGIPEEDFKTLETLSKKESWWDDELLRIQEMYLLILARKEATQQFQNIITLKETLRQEHLDHYIAAVDTVGNEIGYGAVQHWIHQEGLQRIKKAGIRISIHSGEHWGKKQDGTQEDLMGVLERIEREVNSRLLNRMGHATALGINPWQMMVQHPKELGNKTVCAIAKKQYDIMEGIIDQQIYIESLPTANVILNSLVDGYPNHVLATFLAAGLPTVLAQDHKFILHTSQSGEMTKTFANGLMVLGQLLMVLQNGNDPTVSHLRPLLRFHSPIQQAA